MRYGVLCDESSEVKTKPKQPLGNMASPGRQDDIVISFKGEGVDGLRIQKQKLAPPFRIPNILKDFMARNLHNPLSLLWTHVLKIQHRSLKEPKAA